jgi:hypothetical protein
MYVPLRQKGADRTVEIDVFRKIHRWIDRKVDRKMDKNIEKVSWSSIPSNHSKRQWESSPKGKWYVASAVPGWASK